MTKWLCHLRQVSTARIIYQEILCTDERTASSQLPLPTASHLPARYLEDQVASLGSESLRELERHFKTIVAYRRRVFNNDAPLLNLPTELLLEIGKLVLREPKMNDFNNGKEVHDLSATLKMSFLSALNFLQTCTQLREQLRPIRGERLFLAINLTGSRTQSEHKAIKVLGSQLLDWSWSGVHTGPVTVLLKWAPFLDPSTAAAWAGYAETIIYGSLAGASYYLHSNRHHMPQQVVVRLPTVLHKPLARARHCEVSGSLNYVRAPRRH